MKIVVLIFSVLCIFAYDVKSKSVADGSCKTIEMASITPFIIIRNDDPNQFGLEFNNWRDVHPSERGCNPINGYGARILFSSKGGTVSPYLQSSVMELIGVSTGPEIGIYRNKFDLGINARLWVPLVGVESRYAFREGFTVGLYLYFPFHQKMIQ